MGDFSSTVPETHLEVGKVHSHLWTAPICYDLMAIQIPAQNLASLRNSPSLAATPVSQSEYVIVKPSSSLATPWRRWAGRGRGT